MKFIDKFLKKINASRNTFATYVLTLITIYLAVDRIVEMLLMIFTGVAVSYWGPVAYTFALACPIFAFLFSGPSEFASSKKQKVTMFFLYVIALYIIAISMFTQWLNFAAWMLLVFSPNYVEIIEDFSDLVGPAFTSLSLYLPLVTIFPLFKWLFFGVNDSKDQTRSIWDYAGISLSKNKKDHGAYSYEIYVCKDDETGQTINFCESARFRSLFVCGGSGSGKTSLVFEPFIARDIEKKSFFREVSKELGFTALKTRIAVLNAPYDNNYLNKNFNLNMISPAVNKEAVFNSFLKKLVLHSDINGTVFKDLGITVMSPDDELIVHMIDVCKNFGFEYNIIDPSNPDSIGLNPFVYDDPSKIAITISSALKSMHNDVHNDINESYREDISIRAIENLAILLKEMYPRMNEGMLPNLNDLLKMLTNFDLIEKMCKIMAHNESLAKQYAVQLSYFEKNFYKDAPGRKNIEKYIFTTATQLDNLLRIPGVKKILCNRHNNINFDDMLAQGQLTFICTRRGDLGVTAHKAFGLFFLMSMQNSVLRRPGSSESRIPNFLYIDEFADYICKDTEPIFTMYRKYKVGTTISTQNLAQLDSPDGKHSYRNTILSNCGSKIFTGNAVIEELDWWSKEFGNRREWTYSNSMDMETMKYDSKYGNVQWKFVEFFKAGKLQTGLTNTSCAFKIMNDVGKYFVGLGVLKYLESRYKEPQPIKRFDFEKYSNDLTGASDDNSDSSNEKFDLKNINFKDDRDEFDPIKMNTSDSNYIFDNSDAIIMNLKNKKKKDN